MTTHIWVSGNSFFPRVTETLCGLMAQCVANMKEASCKECQRVQKKKEVKGAQNVEGE